MASAQITIEAVDIPQTVGDSCQYKYCASEATVNNGEAGGPHTWTFDTSAYAGYVLTTTIVDVTTSPFLDRFPGANLCTAEPRGQYTLYVYNSVQSLGFLECGYGAWFGGSGKAWVNNPPATNLPLPATLDATWQTNFQVTDTTGADTVQVVVTDRRCTIDAWGTAVTPSGSYPCLRENWVVGTVTTTYVSGTPVHVDTSIGRRYLWMAKAVGVVAMTHSMEGDTSLNFTQADDYMVMVLTSSGGVQETPNAEIRTTNPGATILRGVLVLSETKGAGRKAKGVLLDASGRTVLNLRPGANDLRSLAPGIYFYQVENDAALSRKVIKLD